MNADGFCNFEKKNWGLDKNKEKNHGTRKSLKTEKSFHKDKWKVYVDTEKVFWKLARTQKLWKLSGETRTRDLACCFHCHPTTCEAHQSASPHSKRAETSKRSLSRVHRRTKYITGCAFWHDIFMGQTNNSLSQHLWSISLASDSNRKRCKW
jgi:predicted DNA-binding ribbon-helix-helix protein